MARSLADLPDDPRYAFARAECLTNESEFGYMTDDGDAMIRHAREALAIMERAPMPTRQTLFDAQGALAYGYYLTRQNKKAEEQFDLLSKAMDRAGRGRTLAAADLFNDWGLVHFLGDIRKSEPLYRRSLELHRSIEERTRRAPASCTTMPASSISWRVTPRRSLSTVRRFAWPAFARTSASRSTQRSGWSASSRKRDASTRQRPCWRR